MRIGIVGFGNMGTSLSKLLSKNGYDYNIVVSDSKEIIWNKSMNFWYKSTNFCYKSTEDNIKTSEILFLMIKPKDMRLLDLKKTNAKLIISCVAGVSIENIEKYTNLPIIRIMSNLPIEDGKGTIIYTKNSKVSYDQLYTFLKICHGPKIMEISEDKLDISTILAGCMPAFISHLSEEYINFGIEKGLTREESLNIYTSSVIGSIGMMENYDLKDIIKKVSSPGGVTEEGIKSLQESRVNQEIKKSLHVSFDKIKRLKD
jgi:pyrroline-5-carboxylate reductase